MSLTRKMVLKTIQERADKDEPLTLEAIAEAVGCHQNTAWRAVKDLRSTGQIEMIQRGGPNRPTVYKVLKEAHADN